MGSKNIYVTQPYLPPLEEFIIHLEEIWGRKIITNSGPCHVQLEQELSQYLGVKFLSLTSNGTLALSLALQAMELSGEVITTPYSFVATTHALIFQNIKPIFVDIEPKTLNLDPNKVESAITEKTTAILPVHCYGNSCNVEAIQKIADKHNLKIIYDGAHAFGVEDFKGSILNHGDLSILSFHATKVFNTFEGGAVISHDREMKAKIDRLKNFGFENEISVLHPGINAKMSEINAAMGLVQLKHMASIIDKRMRIDKIYRRMLASAKGVYCLDAGKQTKSNYSYFPIIVNNHSKISRDELYELLKQRGIYTRRYFYPIITEFQAYRSYAPINKKDLETATDTAARVLCLPIYPSLGEADAERVIAAILELTE
jgi:dTDP-4-amino-4,6-dideoxygalactose transaminase